MGYHRAGFDVTGVDIEPQRRYPFRFHRADALEYLAKHGRRFDAIHASPPCQRYSRLFTTMEELRGDHPDLVGPTRELLEATGRPWIIENVQGAPLQRGSIMLCGAMFGLRTYRHRWFESPGLLLGKEHPRHAVKSDKGSRRKEYFEAGGFISVVGNVGSYCGPAAMGIDWMTGEELSQAIPPAYCHFIGNQLMNVLEGNCAW
jgi:DNA (cytosine-5)-methyltransferase 1